MPKVSIVEKRIFEIEGFQVDIIKDGKNVRGDSQLPKQYEAERMTRNSMTVGDWKNKFKTQYAGYDAIVYKNDGSRASGQTKLATVRDTYLEDFFIFTNHQYSIANRWLVFFMQIYVGRNMRRKDLRCLQWDLGYICFANG